MATLAREYELNAQDAQEHVPQPICASLRNKAVAGFFISLLTLTREERKVRISPALNKESSLTMLRITHLQGLQRFEDRKIALQRYVFT